jgi:hypothetical protein
MKKIISTTLVLLAIGIYFFSNSCNRNDYTQEIAKVDSLFQQVNSYKLYLDSIDSTSVMEYATMVAHDLKWISDSLAKESMAGASVFLFKVRTGNKLLENFPVEYAALKKEVNFSHKQLLDLKVDLQNGSIEKVQVITYLKDEKLALKAIEIHFNKLKKRLEILKDYPVVRKDFYLKVREQGTSIE